PLPSHAPRRRRGARRAPRRRGGRPAEPLRLRAVALRGGVMNAAPLAPFGLAVLAPEPGADPRAIPASLLHGWIREHRLVVLRGFGELAGAALPAFSAALGELCAWEFGVVNELTAREGARNYIYTDHEVPFHWDGAFGARAPRYIVFACDDAP